MKKSIVVNVTAKDISLGEQGECRRCPIARALSRKLGGKVVQVFTHSFLYYRSAGRVMLPKRAQEFIYDFDLSRPVRPFRFTVNVGAL